MQLDHLAVVVLTALSTVSIVVIAALGLAVLMGVMGVVNLAHGEFLTAGAYVALVATRLGLPLPLAVVAAAVALGLWGFLVERVIMRPLYGRMFDTMLATWGLSLAMYQLAVVIFGPATVGIAAPMGSVAIGSFRFSRYNLILIAIAIALVALVYFIFSRTRFGIVAQATVQMPEMAAALGVDARHVNMLTFGLGSALAGAAGALLAPIYSATPAMGQTLMAPSFLAVVLAGPLAATGTAVSSLLLGSTSSVISYWTTTALGQLGMLLVAVLILRIYRRGISVGWRFKF